MQTPLILSVSALQGALQIRCGPPGAQAVQALGQEAELHLALEHFRAQLSELGVLLPGDDAVVSAVEDTLGQALWRALFSDPQLATELGVALGRAGDQPLSIAIDAPPGPLSALPWELLSNQGQGLEETGRGFVLRLLRGGALPQSGPRVPVGVWSADEGDPVLGPLHAHLQQACDQHLGRPPVDLRAHPQPAQVLFLLAHARDTAELLSIQGSEGELGVGTLTQTLLPALRGSGLVVVAACDAERGAHPKGLAQGVLSLGARACLAPSGVVHLKAAQALASGLLEAHAAGHPLQEVVASGRRQVRALGLPQSSGRWSRWRLSLSQLEALGDTPTATSLTGLPAHGELGQLWSRAEQHARVQAGGFLGAEHLFLALADSPPLPGLDALRYRCVTQRHALLTRLGSLSVSASDQPFCLTPRLQALLPKAATCQQLFTALEPVAQALLGSHAGADLRPYSEETLVSTEADAGPAVRLEVVGGPEDGRTLQPHPGDWLGRWSPTHPQGLYRDTRVTDRSLSRTQARWVGPGLLHLPRGLKAQPQLRDLCWRQGELLFLGAATCLIGRGP